MSGKGGARWLVIKGHLFFGQKGGTSSEERGRIGETTQKPYICSWKGEKHEDGTWTHEFGGGMWVAGEGHVEGGGGCIAVDLQFRSRKFATLGGKSTSSSLPIIFLIFWKQNCFLLTYKKRLHNRFPYIFLYQLNTLSYSYFIFIFFFFLFFFFLSYIFTLPTNSFFSLLHSRLLCHTHTRSKNPTPLPPFSEEH